MSSITKIECGACGGTGLYSGFAEPEGVAVICHSCRGKGHGTGSKVFHGRKRLKGVRTVWLGAAPWFARDKDHSKSVSKMTADEFYSDLRYQ